MIRKSPTMGAEEIRARCANIGLQRGDLALRAHCSPTTVSRILSGRDCRTDSLGRIVAAVVEQEVRLRDYLLALHPVKAEEVAA